MTAHRTASAATALDVRATPRKRFVQPLDEMTVADALRCYAARDHETVKLLRPPAIFSASSYSTPLTLPLGPAYLAGTLEAAGYRVEVVDAIGEGILQIRKSADGRLKFQGLTTEEIIQRIGPETRVLGVSLMFSQGWVQYRELVRRSSGRTPISSSCSAASIRRRCPSTCCGTARRSTTSSSAKASSRCCELLWRHFGELDVAGLPGLAYLDESGAFVSNGPSQRVGDFANLPRPAWHLCEIESFFRGSWFHGIPYGRNMLILATRGCPYQCTFCSNPMMWTTRYMMRPPADVVDEIEWLISTYGANSIDFEDLTAIVKKDWTIAFCNEMKSRKLDVVWQLPSGTRSEALDSETLQALYDTGCRLLVYAPESGSEEVALDHQEESEPRPSDRESQGSAPHRPYRQDQPDHRLSPRDPARLLEDDPLRREGGAARAHDCLISAFTPYPGSELFEELRRDGTIPTLDDSYFKDLLLQFDATVNTSYCRHVGGRELGYYRILGMSLFYLISFARSPRRGLRVLAALFNRRTSRRAPCWSSA